MTNNTENGLGAIESLTLQCEVPPGIAKAINMAWAIARHGAIPENYLICELSFWDKVCRTLGYYPRHVECTSKGVTYIAFVPDETIRNRG